MVIRLRTLLLLAFFGSMIMSCEPRDNYLNDPSISMEDGTPIDSLTNYLPPDSFSIDGHLFPGVGYQVQKQFSLSLWAMEEPVLRNFYLGHDIYRFTYFRAFHPPMAFSLNRKNGQVWITTKELSRNTEFIPKGKITFEATTDQESGKKSIHDFPIPKPSQSEEETAIRLTLNEKKNLSIRDWEEFEGIIQENGFWQMKPIKDGSGLDGSNWIIEGHLKTGYTVVHRWSPKDSLREIGEYLIKKSGQDLLIY